MANEITVGSKVRFTWHHIRDTVTFSARVVRVLADGTAWVEMPARVRALPFPPLGGKRFGLYRIADLVAVS